MFSIIQIKTSGSLSSRMLGYWVSRVSPDSEGLDRVSDDFIRS